MPGELALLISGQEESFAKKCIFGGENRGKQRKVEKNGEKYRFLQKNAGKARKWISSTLYNAAVLGRYR